MLLSAVSTWTWSCGQPAIPLPGETTLGGDFFTFPGGKGANQAVAAARLGGHVKIVGRVGTDAFIVLVLFWHPLLSFVIPVLVGETLLTSSHTILSGLPDPVRRLLLSQKARRALFPALAVVLSTIPIINSPSPLHSLASGLSTTAVLLLLTYIWREKTDGKSYDLPALLPNQREAHSLLVPLLLYLVLGILDRREALPGVVGHLTIWVIYCILFGLLALSL